VAEGEGSAAALGRPHGAIGRYLALLICVVCLGLAGALLRQLVNPIESGTRRQEPALRTVATAGPGVALALLGGFRALVADAVWIRLYVTWEKRDLPATDSAIRFVSTIDPRPVYFWLNGARIMAYDFAAWRIEAEGGDQRLAQAGQDLIVREQGRRALGHLERALAFHPASADLWIERANIELNRIQDVAAAAESYRRAAQVPRAPYYAARLHAETLRRLGRHGEALDWLVKLHPTLPADESAARDVVLARIRDLERLTGAPMEQVYRPPPP
jgi:tetratricopeptide (TPR) repeat protein